MPQRNMKQLAKKTNDLLMTRKYLPHYAMNIDEICELHQMCIDGKDIEALNLCFALGFALGSRAHDRQRIPAL